MPQTKLLPFRALLKCSVPVLSYFICTLNAPGAGHGISAANINVVQNDTGNTTNSVTVTATLAINDMRIRPGSNRGDYNVQVGPVFSDDVNTGALITSVAENGRYNGESNYPGKNYCTVAVNYSRSGANTGAFYIPVFNAPAGAEYNINVAAAFFPYDRWIAGYARNSAGTANGPNNLFTGSPGLTLGTHFVDHGGGLSTVNLTSLGIDSRTDGIVLVSHGDNADNYALSKVNNDGTWSVYVKDNGSNSSELEQGAVVFVYVPKTNTTVVSGRFAGDGTILFHSDVTPRFSVTNTTVGTWRLTIPGHNPDTGVLIISPEGGQSYNQDNIVSYERDGDGWLIQSRDLPGNPPALQTPQTEPVASFVFIPVTATTRPLNPATYTGNHIKSPALRVGVTNAVSGQVTVQFYGREAVKDPSADFMVVALPDTQYYTALRNGGREEMFVAQTEWVITNRIARNIAYVTHLGDISNDGDVMNDGSTTLPQWMRATNAMYRLENPLRTLLPYGIPYGMAVGNHDQEPNGAPNGTSIFYNQFFGVSRFQGRPYYGGHYGNDNDNHFDFFSAGGMDFIVLYFEYDNDADPAVLEWGRQVLQTNLHRRAIIVTHHLGNTQTPVTFRNQGQQIYNKFRAQTNVFMMLSGHVTGQGSRTDTYNGHTIRTFVSDYQGWENGGNGFMRLIEFSPRRNQVVLQTYSPWLNQFTNGPTSDLYFSYPMQSEKMPDPPFNLIATVNNVNSGAEASAVWPNLKAETEYEWRVVVTDSQGNSTVSPVWWFKTAEEAPPSVSHRLVNVMGDTATNLLLTAVDPNGEPVKFGTNSWPMFGMNLDFNPDTGAITYQPARGFRGFDQFDYYAYNDSGISSVATVVLNVQAPVDANNNGLPDSWELLYGITNPDADDDGDGLTNRQEYLANTNPKDPNSTLRIDLAAPAFDGTVTLTWRAVGGTRYRVQYSEADSDGGFLGTFTDIVRPIKAEMGLAPYGQVWTNSFVDDFSLTGGSTNRARYYRIKVVQ